MFRRQMCPVTSGRVDNCVRVGQRPYACLTKRGRLGNIANGGGERFWKRQVVDQLERGGGGARAWREEVEQRQDLGAYKDKQLVLARADYVKNRSGEKARKEIKKKCEWGDHFLEIYDAKWGNIRLVEGSHRSHCNVNLCVL